jgi:hypothetical protein
VTTVQNGDVQLSLRDKNGGLLGGFRLHYSDLDLAPPPKRGHVVVLAGKDKGKTGTVNVSNGSCGPNCMFSARMLTSAE